MLNQFFLIFSKKKNRCKGTNIKDVKIKTALLKTKRMIFKIIILILLFKMFKINNIQFIVKYYIIILPDVF